MPFGVVCVQESVGRRLVDDLGQLPSQVHGILHARIQPLAAMWGVHVCGVAGEQYTAPAVGRGLARRVGEPGDPAGAAQPVVGPVHGDECVAELS